MKHKPVTV